MRSAERILRELDDHLDLPARRRVVLLRELRADLEDLVSTLVAEGHAPEEARARAVALLAPTLDDVRALTSLHRSTYARVIGRVPSRITHWVELSGVWGMAAFAVLAPLLALGTAAGLPWWAGGPLGVVAALVAGHLAWNAFRVLVREDTSATTLMQAAVVQAGLIGLALSVGASVTLLEGWAAMGRLAAGSGLADMTASLATCAATAALALSIGMLGLFGAAALAQALTFTRGVEEELRRLLSAVPVSGDEP